MRKKRKKPLLPAGKIILGIALAALFPSGAMAQVDTSIEFNSAPSADPVTGSYSSLAEAADGVNGAVAQGDDAENPYGGPSHDAALSITIGGGLTVDADSAAAVFNGYSTYTETVTESQINEETGLPEDVEVEVERQTWKGFRHVTLNGGGNYISNADPNASLQGSLLSIEHVSGAISVSNIGVSGGWRINGGGGGLYIGLLRSDDFEAPAPVGFSSASVNGAVFINNYAGGLGGGLAISNKTVGSSNIELTNLQLLGNGVSGYSSLGGGAGIQDIGSGAAAFNFSDGTVEYNYAAAWGGNAGGGGVAVEANGKLSSSISGVLFENNLVAAYGGSGGGPSTARGGGFYGSGSNGLAQISRFVFDSGTAFINNQAVAEGPENSHAVGGGGAIYGNASSTFTGVTFDGNQADASLGGNAYGGGLFAQGSVSINNGAFTNNHAIGGIDANGQALGGAMFIDVSTNAYEGSVVILSAPAESDQVLIAGNTANGQSSGIHFGNAETNVSRNDATLNIAGSGQVLMLDALSVDLNNSKSFTLTKDDDGVFTWGAGNNRIAAYGAEINLNQGRTELTRDFSLAVAGGAGLQMNINKTGADLTAFNFDSRRLTDLAMFDLTGAGGNSNFLVEAAGATMDITDTRRQLVDLEKTYIIVKDASGIYDQQFNNLQFSDNLKGSSFAERNGNVVLDLDYTSPYTAALNRAGQNTVSGASALTGLLRSDEITEDMLDIIHANFDTVTPEYGLVAGNMSLNVTRFISRMAVRQGLRVPHNSSLPTPLHVQPAFGGADEGVRVWGGYAGNFRRVDSAGGYYGYDQDSHAGVLGLNYDLGPAASIGVFGGYSNNKADLNDISSEVESDGTHVGLLARLTPMASLDPNLAVYLDAAYARYENDAYRRLSAERVTSDFNQTAFTAGLGVEYAVAVDYEVLLTPSLDLRYTKLEQDDYREQGLTASRVRGYDANSFTSALALAASREISISGGTITPSARIGWNHEYGDADIRTSARYINPAGGLMPGSYRLGTVRQDRDSMDAGVAVNALLNSGSYHQVGLNISYDANISKNADTHSVYGGLEYRF